MRKTKGTYAAMTEQLLEGKLIAGGSSALITGPCVNSQTAHTSPGKTERWEGRNYGGMRGGMRTERDRKGGRRSGRKGVERQPKGGPW